jgi:OmpA-OmpF porin, OOP family
MGKLLPIISGVACFLWVSGWTWIITDGKQAASSSSSHSPINILLDSVQYDVQQPFAFEYSEATPIVAENLHPALKSVVKKLEAQPKSAMKIIGVYSPMEENETSFPNLGLARAESVKSILEASGAVGDQIETVGLESANLFQIDGKLMGAIYFSFAGQNTDYQVVAVEDAPAEDDEEPSAAAQSFYYKYGDYKVEKQHHTTLKELMKELKTRPNHKVVLTGYSADEEEAESARINLAEMRAMAIRRYLVDHGVRRAQIETRAKPSMARTSKEMTVSIQIVKG